MVITKREILVSVFIIALDLGLGMFISGKIFDGNQKKLSDLRHTTIIKTSDEFRHCIETELGKFISEDTLYCLDPVSIEDIPGEYMCIQKVKEEYRSHTRTRTDSKGNTHIETYYSWDVVKRWEWKSEKIYFLGQRVSVRIPRTKYLLTKEKLLSDVRYKYYTTETRVPGVLKGTTESGRTLGKCKFKEGRTIEKIQHRQSVEMKSGPIVFWIVWIFMTIVSVCLFYSGDYTWLEKD